MWFRCGQSKGLLGLGVCDGEAIPVRNFFQPDNAPILVACDRCRRWRVVTPHEEEELIAMILSGEA